MNAEFKPGDVIWFERENKPQLAIITDILVDAGGWCYLYKFRCETPFGPAMCHSGGKNVFATKSECEKVIAKMK